MKAKLLSLVALLLMCFSNAALAQSQTGAQDDPIIVAWDAESFNAPASNPARTYYQLESNYEGVLSIDCSAITGATMSDLFINNKRVGNVTTREVLVSRHDVIVFALACQEDNSANQVKLTYRALAEGEVWNMPVVLAQGENEAKAITQNIDLAKWYKVTIPAGQFTTISMPFAVAQLFTAGDAAAETNAIDFKNTAEGMEYFVNNEGATYDLYIKVEAQNEAGNINVDSYYTLFDNLTLNGPAAAANFTDYTIVNVLNRYEGVIDITNNTNAYQIALLKNGKQIINSIAKEGKVTSILASQGDMLTFKMLSQDDQMDNTIELKGRALAEGEGYTTAIALGEEAVKVPVIKNNIELPMWYKLVIPAKGNYDIVASDPYAGLTAYRDREDAMNEKNAIQFENGVLKVQATQACEIFVKVAYENVEGATLSVVSYNKTLAWDAEGFNGPTAGMTKTVYTLNCNYEGVMSIDCSAIKGSTLTDLYINGTRVGNVVTRDIIVNRHDVIVFAMACMEDNSENQVKLTYRDLAEGEVWNMPVALAQGDNESEAVSLNIDLAKWYKVTIPAGQSTTITMPHAVAKLFTAADAANEVNALSFRNTTEGMEYYVNNEGATYDLYIKVEAQNEDGNINVDSYYTLFDNITFNGPAAAATATDFTIVKVLNRYEGVIDITNNTSAYQIALLKNGEQIINSIAKEGKVTTILASQGDILTFKMLSQDDQMDNTIELKGRALAEGESFGTAIILGEEAVKVPVIKNNINLPMWYKLVIPAEGNYDIVASDPYGVTAYMNREDAMNEQNDLSFENGVLKIQATQACEVFVKVAFENEEDATLSVVNYNKTLAWDAEGFNAPAAGMTKTAYTLECNYEGVMSINCDAIKGATLTDLYINGTRVGNVVTRDIIVNRHDVIVFAMACQEDNSENQVKISYRALAEGESYGNAIVLGDEPTEVPAIKNNINLPMWYKLVVPGMGNYEIVASDPYAGLTAYMNREDAMNEQNALSFAEGVLKVQATQACEVFVKVAFENVEDATLSVVSYNKTLAWDTESFNAPAAGMTKTIYTLESNYEGVMSIDCSAIEGATMSDLYINGQRVGNVATREVIVNRRDVIVFALACQEDNSANEIKLSYRSIEEGDVWNNAIAIENATEIPAIKNNINLPKWYKLTAPADETVILNVGYGVASIYTADDAATEANAESFTNANYGMNYTYTNEENTRDLYIKISAMNEPCVAHVISTKDFEIGEAGFATFCSPVDATLEGATAYAITGIDEENVVILKEVNVIPANTGVLLEGKPGQLTLVPATKDADIVTENCLTGVMVDTPAHDGSYVLQTQKGVTGFYRVSNEVAVTVPAYHALLDIPAEDVKTIFIDTETAIRAIEAIQAGNGKIYDLNGRQLQKLQKGMNIVNGVKVLVK